MAPPLPLSTVAGTLALSFTAGRAAPSTTPSVQQPTSVPAPPSLPPLPGETAPEATEPATTEPATTEPATTEPEPTEPEPTAEPQVAPLGPSPAYDEVETPLPTKSEDEPKRLLRPNRRPLMFSLFAGGSRALRGSYSYINDFKIEGAIGGFGRTFRTGGFAVIQVSKGLPFTTFTLAPRLSLNRQIVPDHAVYFTTNLMLGYRLSTVRDGGSSVYDGYGYGSSSNRYNLHSAVIGASWGASVILGERMLLSFRPAEFELVIPAPDVIQLNWAAMAGVGVVWGGGDD